MTSRLANPNGASNLGPLHQPQAGAGRFVLTLCTLPTSVSIRPPQSPQLRPFSFFTSQVRESDGGERIYLHMGYFDTLAEAENWAQSVRRQFPGAFATLAPRTLLPPMNSQEPSSPQDASCAAASQSIDPAPVKSESLTDTQVLKILEARHGPTFTDGADETNLDQISLLRPDDTSVRQALKEAVVQGEPVSFAVQLHWSTRPINVDRMRALRIFKTHILYATESRRNGRSRYFLRLGFFADPSAAKQVAAQARRIFDSAAVVPVIEPEVTRAREAGAHTLAIPYLQTHDVDQLSNSYEAAGSPVSSKSWSEATHYVLETAETGREMPDPRAERDIWTEPDSLSESGVRHLRVEVQEQMSGRWRKIRLSEKPSAELEVPS
jgi:hypothetical protein